MSRSEVTHEEAGSQFYSRAESHTTNNTSRSLPDPKFARTWTRSEDWERTTEDFNQVEGVKVGKVNKKRNSIFGNTLQPSKRIYESASSLSPMVSTRTFYLVDLENIDSDQLPSKFSSSSPDFNLRIALRYLRRETNGRCHRLV